MQPNIKYTKQLNNQNSNQRNHLLYPIKDMIKQLDHNTFTKENLTKFTQNIYVPNANSIQNDMSMSMSNINNRKEKGMMINKNNNKQFEIRQKPTINDEYFKPRQKDSLFWCFYILKYGFGKYEMEVGNQHFVIEKQEKFKYIEQMRH